MYGVMDYVVHQRTKELGIRLALGATSGDIVRFFLRYCLRLSALGLIGGTAISLGLSAVIGKLVAMIDAFDPVAYGGGMCVVVLAGVLSAAIPISRVARSSSIEAIRQE